MSIVRVAAAAGVSHTTVSRVLNGHASVSPHTAQLVRRAMVQIGYTPPLRRRGPRSLRTRGLRTGHIAVLYMGMDLSLIQMPVFASALHGIERALGQQRLHMSVIPAPNLDRMPASVSSRSVDGLILVGQTPLPRLADELQRYPLVWLMSRGSCDWGDRVNVNNAVVGEMAAQYLIRQGHRHLAALTLEANHPAMATRVERFLATATQAPGVDAVVLKDSSPRPGQALTVVADEDRVQCLVDQVVAMSPQRTGLFIPSDVVTGVAYRLLNRRGIRPGRDITIISCNNERPLLASLDPRPATIDIRAEAIGRRAVDQLLWRIANPDEPGRVEVAIDPILMESDAPASTPAIKAD